MLKRRIYDFLLEWKQRQNKKPLIVNGARQVGKTYIIREFGKQEYNNFLEINFILNPEMKSIFSSSLLVDDILTRLSLYFPNFNFTRRRLGYAKKSASRFFCYCARLALSLHIKIYENINRYTTVH